MERTDPGLFGGIVEGDGFMRIGVDPQRALHGPAAVAQACGDLLGLAPAHRLDKAGGQEMADLVEAHVAAAICCRLRELGEHHQFGQRRRGADLPDPRIADGIDQFGREKKRQALIANGMSSMHASMPDVAALQRASTAGSPL